MHHERRKDRFSASWEGVQPKGASIRGAAYPLLVRLVGKDPFASTRRPPTAEEFQVGSLVLGCSKEAFKLNLSLRPKQSMSYYVSVERTLMAECLLMHEDQAEILWHTCNSKFGY